MEILLSAIGYRSGCDIDTICNTNSIVKFDGESYCKSCFWEGRLGVRTRLQARTRRQFH